MCLPSPAAGCACHHCLLVRTRRRACWQLYVCLAAMHASGIRHTHTHTHMRAPKRSRSQGFTPAPCPLRARRQCSFDTCFLPTSIIIASTTADSPEACCALCADGQHPKWVFTRVDNGCFCVERGG